MCVKGCPEEYDYYFSHELDAVVAGEIEKAISKHVSPSQTDVEGESERALRHEFHIKYDFRIIIKRDYGPGDTRLAFLLDIGHGMGDENSDKIITSAIKENSAMVLPYVYRYPGKSDYSVVPYLKEESGIFTVYAICRNAPASDKGRVLAEMAAEYYIKNVESYKGHFFQVSTKSFVYSRPYK